MDQAFVFAVLVFALVLFVWGRWRYDIAGHQLPGRGSTIVATIPA